MPETVAPPTKRRPPIDRARDAVTVFRAQPRWSKTAMLSSAAVVVLLAIALTVTAGQASEAAAGSSEELARLSETIDTRDGTASELRGDLKDAKREVGEVDAREAELDRRDASLAARTTEADARSAGLDARETAVGTAETAKKANSFTTGTFTVGTDIQPGTYQTPGTDRCYYARLSGTGGQLGDIIANGNPRGQAIVTIEAGDKAFNSQGCGTWTKTG